MTPSSALSTNHFTDLNELAPTALFLIEVVDDGCLRVATANAAFSRMIGMGTEQIIGMLVDDIFGEANRSIIRKHCSRAVRESKPDQFTISIPCNGVLETLSANVTPVLRSDGKCLSLAGTCHKLSKQSANNDSMSETELRYRSLVAAMPTGLVCQNARGDVLTCNQSAEQILGIEQSKIIGKPLFNPLWKIIQENGDPFDMAKLPPTVAIRSGVTQSCVVMGICKPHLPVNWIEVSSAPLYYESAKEPYATVSSFTGIASRKKTKDELRVSERRLAEAQKIARIGSWNWEPVSDKVTWSESICEIFGVDAETAKPSFESFLALVHPDDRKIALARVEAVINGENAFNNDIRMIKPNGDTIWLNSRARVTRNPAGEIIIVEGTDQDITDRKRSEQFLTTQHKAGLILDEASDLLDAAPRLLQVIAETTYWDLAEFWTKDEQLDRIYLLASHRSQIESSDETSRSITTYNVETLVHEAWVTATPTWVESWYAEDTDRVAQSKYCVVVIPISIGKDVVAAVSLLSHGMRRKDSGLLYVLNDLGVQVGHFIERKSTEARLRLFRALLDQTTDFIEVIAPESGKILDVNLGACDAHGYTRDEYLKLNISEIDTSNLSQDAFSEMLQDLRRRRRLTIEGEHRRKDGSVFPVEVNANLITLEREYIVAVVRDITERKRVEEQIRQSQKMDAIGRLAGGVAHDFNNLLTVMNCHSELLLAITGDNDELTKHLLPIKHAGNRAAELTSQLLAFSRQNRSEPQAIDLNRTVRECAIMLKALFRENLSIVFELASDAHFIKGDPGQIERVLVNLSVNASDAMPHAGTLTFKTYNVVPPKANADRSQTFSQRDYVCLEIKDTGVGIAEDMVGKIFEPFFTTKDVGKGTGLGLSVVHGIMTQCGGSIEVQSELGKGTTFVLSFPSANPTIVAANQINTTTTDSLEGKTILVVDDEEAIRNVVRSLLVTNGFKVVVADSGKAAMEFVENNQGRIDLVLTDVMMPDVNGVALASEIAAKHKDVRTILMSGYAGEFSYKNYQVNFDAVLLNKPFTPAALLDAVRRCLSA